MVTPIVAHPSPKSRFVLSQAMKDPYYLGMTTIKPEFVGTLFSLIVADGSLSYISANERRSVFPHTSRAIQGTYEGRAGYESL